MARPDPRQSKTGPPPGQPDPHGSPASLAPKSPPPRRTQSNQSSLSSRGLEFRPRARSGSAPRRHSQSAAARCPRKHASSRAVTPLRNGHQASILAPCSSKNSIILICPVEAAQASGLRPTKSAFSRATSPSPVPAPPPSAPKCCRPRELLPPLALRRPASAGPLPAPAHRSAACPLSHRGPGRRSRWIIHPAKPARSPPPAPIPTPQPGNQAQSS